jgi:hypothetical protein
LEPVAKFTAVLCLVGIIQYSIFEKTDDTLRAAQRPWMKFTSIVMTKPLHCEANEISTTLQFTMRNTGTSPALHVLPKVGLNIEASGRLSDLAQHEICDPLRTEDVTTRPGIAVFPGSDDDPVGEMEISATRIGPPHTQWIFPTILACIDYRFPFGYGESHQTGEIWNVTSQSAPHPVGLIECPPGTDIQPTDLDRSLSGIGNYAD